MQQLTTYLRGACTPVQVIEKRYRTPRLSAVLATPQWQMVSGDETDEFPSSCVVGAYRGSDCSVLEAAGLGGSCAEVGLRVGLIMGLGTLGGLLRCCGGARSCSRCQPMRGHFGAGPSR